MEYFIDHVPVTRYYEYDESIRSGYQKYNYLKKMIGNFILIMFQ